jgi:hypothetical protein
MAWTPYKKKNYIPGQKDPFKLSRSKIDMFLECPRCFYLDRRLGITRPSMPTFTLNNAVDHLLKKEFDIHRSAETVHPLVENYGLNLRPYQHPSMGDWRENFVGVQYLHKDTNFLVFGAVDDIWIDDNDVLYIVDYKSTSKDKAITDLDDTKWHDQYRRQMEIYQWLLKQNGFKVSDTGYFVYVNGKKDLKAFDGKLEFDINLIPYTGKSDWIDGVLVKAKKCLDDDSIPDSNPDCEHCKYRNEAGEAFKKHVKEFGSKSLSKSLQKSSPESRPKSIIKNKK